MILRSAGLPLDLQHLESTGQLSTGAGRNVQGPRLGRYLHIGSQIRKSPLMFRQDGGCAWLLFATRTSRRLPGFLPNEIGYHSEQRLRVRLDVVIRSIHLLLGVCPNRLSERSSADERLRPSSPCTFAGSNAQNK
jgi:hypothetical protein